MNSPEWLEYEILGNEVSALIIGIAVAVFAWIVLGLLRSVLQKRLSSLNKTREHAALAIAERTVKRTKSWFLLLLALGIGLRFWTLQPATDAFLVSAVTIGFLVQVGLWLTAAMSEALRQRREMEIGHRPEAIAVMDVLGFVVQLVVWTFVVLMIMDNLGVNITALVAGLGIGGVAVALAIQNILGDLFASLSIVLDKPFVVGDFLSVGEASGNVEKVGLKTTRIRSLSGEQLIFSNNDLLSSRIRNYGRMFERRVLFSIGVTYDTPVQTLKRIPDMLREAIETREEVRFDRAHFQKLGDSALLFEVVYYVLSSDYNLYMDIQQAVNFTLFERFTEEGIDFAYPAQVVYLARAVKSPARTADSGA